MREVCGDAPQNTHLEMLLECIKKHVNFSVLVISRDREVGCSVQTYRETNSTLAVAMLHRSDPRDDDLGLM